MTSDNRVRQKNVEGDLISPLEANSARLAYLIAFLRCSDGWK